MREILFRGKCLFDKSFIEGYLFKTKEHTYIAFEEQYDDDLLLSPKNIFIGVMPETVGQFTGLTDKNGNKVFEGDIVYCSVWEDYFEVQIKEGHFALVKDNNTDFSYFEEKMKYIEVVGNIYDIKDEAKEVIKALQENSKTITTLIEKTIDGLQQIKNNINKGIKNLTDNTENP